MRSTRKIAVTAEIGMSTSFREENLYCRFGTPKARRSVKWRPRSHEPPAATRAGVFR